MNALYKLNVPVLYNIPSNNRAGSRFLATEEDTAETARLVYEALHEKGHTTQLVPVDENSIDTIHKLRGDCIFNLIEWTGSDMPFAISAMNVLETLPVPFTGASAHAYEMTSNKHLMKMALDAASLPTARWQYFETGTESVRNDFVYPVIVKLAAEHCSIGMNKDAVVSDEQSLTVRIKERIKSFGVPVIAEEFITGREFQISMLDTPGGIKVLKPAEIVFHSGDPLEFLTYESRWDSNHPDYSASSIRLAALTPAEQSSIEEISLATYKSMELRDYARLDVRMRNGNIIILEANSNPGLDDSDDYGMTLSYKAAGMTFADFIEAIVLSALRRTASDDLRTRRAAWL